MPCVDTYSEAWQFSAFWCIDSILVSEDNSGGAANVFLTDTQVDFVHWGLRPNEGMLLYNLTQDVHGPVTQVTPTQAWATGVTWDDGDAYRATKLTTQTRSMIDNALDIAVSDIHIAMLAQGQCDCDLAEGALGFLTKLNIIDAAAYYQCPCSQPRMSDSHREALLAWVSVQLDALRTGKLVVCHGWTGSETPYVGVIQPAVSQWVVADIILDRMYEE